MDVVLPDELQVLYDRLTPKQKLFVDLWEGDATKTATLAGYATPKQSGSRVLKNDDVCRLIKFTRDAILKPQIATRQDRQKFWTVTMNDTEMDMKFRQKASELLGKSEGDFIEKREISGNITIEEKLRQIVSRKVSIGGDDGY
jgi:phage terminase small subunit